MSLFSGEQPVLGTFGSSTGAPQIVIPSGTAGIDLVMPVTDVTNAVTKTNPTSATALMTQKFPSGALNNLGRAIDIFAAGEVTTGVSSTVTFAVTLNDGTNTRTVATWTTGALTTGQTNLQWEIDLAFDINVAGSSGKVFGHGTYSIPLTAPTAAVSAYTDANTAASSTLDLTQLITLSVTALFGTSNAGNSVTQDLLQITIAN